MPSTSDELREWVDNQYAIVTIFTHDSVFCVSYRWDFGLNLNKNSLFIQGLFSRNLTFLMLGITGTRGIVMPIWCRDPLWNSPHLFCRNRMESIHFFRILLGSQHLSFWNPIGILGIFIESQRKPRVFFLEIVKSVFFGIVSSLWFRNVGFFKKIPSIKRKRFQNVTLALYRSSFFCF